MTAGACKYVSSFAGRTAGDASGLKFKSRQFAVGEGVVVVGGIRVFAENKSKSKVFLQIQFGVAFE